ncbi:MAG: methyltransferase [Rhodobacterales bacterium]|jgi:16S rRNA (guanine1207-N2)-methyltransferase
MNVSRLSLLISQAEIALPETGRIAVYRARPDSDFSALPVERTQFANSFRPFHDRLAAAGFDTVAEIAGEFALSLVEITRSKTETLGLIAKALAATSVGGLVFVDGAKTDGIESALKHCRSLLPIEGSFAKSHGKLFWMTRPNMLPAELDEWIKQSDFRANAAGFITAPGMFSPDKIDTGSALLAAHFDDKLRGRVADLGAGWGWLAAQTLALESVSQIDLYEAEATALTAARLNLTDPRAHFFWTDVAAMPAGAEYDQVIANPPFHQGRAAEPAIGIDFIGKAADILKPKGQFWLVANRQLPYEAALQICFGHVKPLQETPHFKIYLASKPRVGSARKAAQDRAISGR